MEQKLTGKFDYLRSWGKHQYYNLSNGYTVVFEDSPALEKFVVIIVDDRSENTKYCDNWYHGDDIDSLPDFAKDWVKPFRQGYIIRPDFEVVE